MRLTAIRNGLERTISASGGLGRLQMVSKPDRGLCASKNVEPSTKVDCEISHRLERGKKWAVCKRGRWAL